MPQQITPERLKSWIESSDGSLRIIDVRDGDHFGGHVKSSTNVPSSRFAQELPRLESELKNAKTVVFYCQLSQQRGPTCAAAYAKSAPEHQSVYVLEGGFQNWAYNFGKDKNVTESFVSDLYP